MTSIDTLAVHGGERRPGPEGSIVFPIYQSTVYSVEPGTDYHDLRYLRLNSTPSQVYLHDKLAALEGGEAAVATASGMAAVTTVLHSLLRARCRCAGCEQLFRTQGAHPEPVLEIRLEAIHPISDKGLNLVFSDGHGRGIFPWAYLHELGQSIPS